MFLILFVFFVGYGRGQDTAHYCGAYPTGPLALGPLAKTICRGNVDGNEAGSTQCFKNISGLAYNILTRDVYVSETLGHRVRRLSAWPNLVVTTVAGSTNYSKGDRTGKWNHTRFNEPRGLFYSVTMAQLFIVDRQNNKIKVWNLLQNWVHVYAGSAGGSVVNVPRLLTQLRKPSEVEIVLKRMYIADTLNRVVKLVYMPTGIVTHFQNYSLFGPTSFKVNRGTAYVVFGLKFHHIMRTNTITAQTSSYLGQWWYPADRVDEGFEKFHGPESLLVSCTRKSLFVADSGNNRVKEIILGTRRAYWFIGSGHTNWNGAGPMPSGDFHIGSPQGLGLWGSNLLVSDLNNRTSYSVTLGTQPTACVPTVSRSSWTRSKEHSQTLTDTVSQTDTRSISDDAVTASPSPSDTRSPDAQSASRTFSRRQGSRSLDRTRRTPSSSMSITKSFEPIVKSISLTDWEGGTKSVSISQVTPSETPYDNPITATLSFSNSHSARMTDTRDPSLIWEGRTGSATKTPRLPTLSETLYDNPITPTPSLSQSRSLGMTDTNEVRVAFSRITPSQELRDLPQTLTLVLPRIVFVQTMQHVDDMTMLDTATGHTLIFTLTAPYVWAQHLISDDVSFRPTNGSFATAVSLGKVMISVVRGVDARTLEVRLHGSSYIPDADESIEAVFSTYSTVPPQNERGVSPFVVTKVSPSAQTKQIVGVTHTLVVVLNIMSLLSMDAATCLNAIRLTAVQQVVACNQYGRRVVWNHPAGVKIGGTDVPALYMGALCINSLIIFAITAAHLLATALYVNIRGETLLQAFSTLHFPSRSYAVAAVFYPTVVTASANLLFIAQSPAVGIVAMMVLLINLGVVGQILLVWFGAVFVPSTAQPQTAWETVVYVAGTWHDEDGFCHRYEWLFGSHKPGAHFFLLINMFSVIGMSVVAAAMNDCARVTSAVGGLCVVYLAVLLRFYPYHTPVNNYLAIISNVLLILAMGCAVYFHVAGNGRGVGSYAHVVIASNALTLSAGVVMFLGSILAAFRHWAAVAKKKPVEVEPPQPSPFMYRNETTDPQSPLRGAARDTGLDVRLLFKEAQEEIELIGMHRQCAYKNL